MARTRRFLIITFQVAVLGLLASRGFPGSRLIAHACICVFYLAVCRHPTPPVSERAKVRLLVFSLLSYGAWLVNSGGLASPLLPIGLGMTLPALLFFDTPRQRSLFVAGGLALVVAVGLLSLSPVGAVVPPLASNGGHPSAEYLIVMAGSILVTAINISGFWGHVTGAYTKVAIELGNRREEVCSMGVDRARDIEGAAAHLAHEMKNPLASIKALSTHLARGCSLDARTVRRLEVVSTEADRLEAIVDGFISLSRGLGELNLAPTRLAEVAMELKLLLEARAARANVTIEVTGRSELEVVADAKRIQQALLYLTMNAVQASASGQTVTVHVGYVSACPGALVTIIDRGEGMNAATLERLKRPPFSTRPGGAGVGVAVARTLIEQHGGRVDYQSVPGCGTTVTVELPRRPPQQAGTPKLLLEALREPPRVD
jgi:two-component system sensor histidine kinase HydH